MKIIHLTDSQATELAYALDERKEFLLHNCPDSPERGRRIKIAEDILCQATGEGQNVPCYVTYYIQGANPRVLYQAAREHNAYLLSVKGYPLDRYPGPWDYVEGNREYIFLVEVDHPQHGWHFFTEKIY